jgi:hypothetical protein
MDNAALKGQLDQELAESSPPPLGSLVADSLTAGRRLRRRRLVVAVVGVTAAVLLVIGGGSVLVSSLRGAPAAGTRIGSQPSVPPTTAAPASPSAAPVPPTGLPTDVVVARLIALLPPGGTITDVSATSDDFGTDVTLTYTKNGKPGSVAFGVLIGPDPERFICHNPADKTCKRKTLSGGRVVRSLMLEPTVIRADASFPGDIIVFIEADTSVVNRAQAIAITTNQTWLEPPDQAEIDAATQTVAPLRKPGS